MCECICLIDCVRGSLFFYIKKQYIHTTVDPSLADAEGHHNSALFVQWVPHTLKNTTWDKEEEKWCKVRSNQVVCCMFNLARLVWLTHDACTQHLLSICDRFAPGTSDLVVDSTTKIYNFLYNNSLYLNWNFAVFFFFLFSFLYSVSATPGQDREDIWHHAVRSFVCWWLRVCMYITIISIRRTTIAVTFTTSRMAFCSPVR